LAVVWAVGAVPASATEVPRDVVLKYAPELRFHPGERYFPYSPDAFIRRSALNWEGCGLGDDLRPRGTVDAGRLGFGGQAYLSPWISSRSIAKVRFLSCHEDGGGDRVRFRTTDFTRPWAKRREPPLAGRHGFELDVEDAAHRGYAGEPARAPVLYQSGTTRSGKRFVTYWLFYAFNRFESPGPDQTHEGDWEQLAVLLTPELELAAVAYSAHGGLRVWTDSQVQLADGTHPRVFVARGSHATYREPGNYDVFGPTDDQARDGGPTWDTWESARGFASVEERSWWGYGGSWGRISRLHSDLSGPAGPGAWKARYPAEWDRGGG